MLEWVLWLKYNHMQILVGAGGTQGLVKPPPEPQRPPFLTPPSGATSLPLYVGICSVTSVVSDSVRPHGLQPSRLLCPWDSPGKNTGVGCHALLQGIFLTQESNSCLFSCSGKWVLYTSTRWDTLQFLQKPSKSELNSGRTG